MKTCSSRLRWSKASAVLGILLSCVQPIVAKDYVLQSPTARLRLHNIASGQFVLQLVSQQTRFVQDAPLTLQLVSVDGRTQLLSGAYRSVQLQNGALQCLGELRSPRGTQFQFFDTISRDQSGFTLRREVTIATPSAEDAGFSTRFGLAWDAPETARDCDVLLPGAWYRQNQNVPPGWFGSDLNFQLMLHRGDRLGLPLVMARDQKSGATLLIERVGGNATTIQGDSGDKRIINAQLQYGALGFLNAGRLEAVFQFPGSEEERAIIGSDMPPARRFAARAHPVEIGVAHRYTLHFGAWQSASYAKAVELVTKAAIERAQPPLVRADLRRVYLASLGLLDTVIQRYNGTVSVPFQVKVPSGEIKDNSMQMGFVGMALPSAALLLRDGLETKNQDTIERAAQVLDFWAQQAPNPSGVPKNWADFPAEGKVTFRNYPTHLRVACDGMRGALRAWEMARRHGLDKPQWLQLARSWGDFLVSHQNADASWFGSWNWDGTPHTRYTNASTHPLAFLVDLAHATGDLKYRNAALKAGEFCLQTVNAPYSYVGGTPDNPNVTDKEAGLMALQGFLALYDATNERKYLQAAQQAAIFCETWVYWRDLPMPPRDELTVFPAGRNTIGISLISTGHSGADDFMGVAPFDWYRLYLATGDAHFLKTARLLLHDTKQLMDWDGKLGYKYAGLLPEAMSLSTERGHGVAGWLPWLTVVNIEPLVRLQETFGAMEIDEIERLPKAQRLKLSAQFAHTRGFDGAVMEKK